MEEKKPWEIAAEAEVQTAEDKKPWELAAEAESTSPKSNALSTNGGKSGAQNPPLASTSNSADVISGDWTTQANPLRKEAKIEVPLAKPIDGVQVDKIVQPKPLGNVESIKNSTKNIATQLKTAIPNSALSVVSIEERLLGGFTYLAAKLMGKTDEEADIASKYVPNVASQIVPNSLPIDETREGAFKQIEAYKKELLPTKGVIESYKNKDFKGMAAAAYDGMTSIVSSAAVGGATGGVGIATDMMGSSIYDFNKTKADKLGITVDELYDQNKDEVAIPATIGAAGAALEKIGLKGITKAINTKVANKGVKSIFNMVFESGKEGGTEWLQAGLESANNSLAEGKTAEEAAKDAVNTMTSEQGLEAALKGLVGSAGSVAAGKAAVSLYKVASDKTKQALVPEMDKVQTLVAEKENPNIDDATKAVLDTEIESATNNIYQSVKEGIVNDLNMSDEADSEIQKLDAQQSNLINDYETKKALLDNPNLSEPTKAIIASELTKLEAQITQLDTDKDLIFETDKLKRLAEPTLKKNTSPTNEKYGTVNRNDGKGIVDLTKEEYLKEEGGNQKAAPIVEPLKDIESTKKALLEPIGENERGFYPSAVKVKSILDDYTLGSKLFNELSNIGKEHNERIDKGVDFESSMAIYEKEYASKVSEAYHKAKADGSNPELVKAVEELIGQKQKATPEAEAGETVKTETDGKERREEGRQENVLTPTTETSGVFDADPIESIESKISVAGLRDGFDASKQAIESGASRNSFDPRQSDGENSDESFAKNIERKGKTYRVVGVRINRPNDEIGNSVGGRQGMSYAMIEDDGKLPNNIDELLTKKAIEEGKNLYPNLNLSDSDFILPKKETTSENKGLSNEELLANLPSESEASGVYEDRGALKNAPVAIISKDRYGNRVTDTRYIPFSILEKANKNDRLGGQTAREIAQRGGYSDRELDGMYPNWRKEIAELNKQAENDVNIQQPMGESKVDDGSVGETPKEAEVAKENEGDGVKDEKLLKTPTPNQILENIDSYSKNQLISILKQNDNNGDYSTASYEESKKMVVDLFNSEDFNVLDKQSKLKWLEIPVDKEAKVIQVPFKRKVDDSTVAKIKEYNGVNIAEGETFTDSNGEQYKIEKVNENGDVEIVSLNDNEYNLLNGRNTINLDNNNVFNIFYKSVANEVKNPTPPAVNIEVPKPSIEVIEDDNKVEVKGKVNPKFKAAKKVQGEATTIEMPNGETREAEYMVVESDDILASHNETSFSDTEGYPTTADGRNANSRNYKGDKSAQLKVNNDAKNLKPSIVISDAATPDTGVPIVSEDGIVVSGNGRTMAIKLSQNIAAEKYEAYKADLLKRAAKFGLDPNEVAKMKKPILVKVDRNVKDYSVKTFDEYNGKFQKEESPIDKAIKRSSIIQNNEELKERILSIIGRHETMTDLFENKSDRKELFDLLVANDIILSQETPKYLQPNGEYTADGKDLVNDILIATILSPETLEATSNVKAFRNKIINALPVLSANYKLGENSLEVEINDAIVLQSQIAAMGSQEEFWTHLRQMGMFDVVNPNTVIINRLINGGANNFKKFVMGYNKSMEVDENNLFGSDVVLTKQQVIDNLKQSNLNENEKQVIANLEELYIANEQKRPIGNVEVVGENEAKENQQGEEIKVKSFKKGDGGTRGVFEDSNGNLYKSLEPQELVQDKDGVYNRQSIKDTTTDEHEILSELQDNPHIPKVGKIVETTEGKAFEIERLDEVDTFTKDEYREIQKILNDLNDKGYHVGDRVTVMKRPKTGELVIVDFSAGYKGSRMSRDADEYMQNIDAKLSESDAIQRRQEDMAMNDRYTAEVLMGNELTTEYYLTQRPPSIGTHPTDGLNKIEESEYRGRKVWKLTYDKKLSADQIYKFELTPLITNREYLGQKISGVYGKNVFYVSDIDYKQGKVTLVSELNGKEIKKEVPFREFQKNIDDGKYKVEQSVKKQVKRKAKTTKIEGEQVKPKTAKEIVKENAINEPKNAIDVAKIFRNLFNFSPKESVWAARLFDAKATFMAKIKGISKEDYYKEYWFDNKGEGGLSQQTLPDGRNVTVKNLGVDVVNGFYSPLEKTINETKFDKLPAKQWIEKFAKGEEAKWTGLNEWLSQQQGSVSKADIQQFLKDNRIQVVEVVKGAELKQVKYKQLYDMPNAIYGFAERFIETGDKKFLAEIEKEGYTIHYDNNGEVNYFTKEGKTFLTDETKFSQYQLEGEKENYKEVLVTMPSRNVFDKNKVEIKKNYQSATQGTFDVYYNGELLAKGYDLFSAGTGEYGQKTDEQLNLFAKNLYEKGDKYNKIENKQGNFKSSHFDEPNILVHLRMNTRTDADGNKVLFLEEVQSDWGQKGKKEGFRNEKDSQVAGKKALELAKKINDKYPNEVKVEINQDGSNAEVYKKIDGEWKRNVPRFKYSEEQRNDIDVLKENSATVSISRGSGSDTATPQAPFVTDTNAWTKLGLKYALKEAVKQGATKIAWTTGEQQNDRYDLSKQVSKIDVEHVDEAEGVFFVDIALTDGEVENLEVENGIIRNNPHKGQRLDAVLGKEYADKILSTPKGESISLTGNDLKLGGKGMKGFYGSPTEGSLGIVGNVAKSLFKQEPKIVKISKVELGGEDVGEYGVPYEAVQFEKYISQFPKNAQKFLLKFDSNFDNGTYKNSDFISDMKGVGYDIKLDELTGTLLSVKENGEYIKYNGDLLIQNSIDITPELKAQASEGQPLFQDRKGSWSKEAAKMKRLISMYSKADSTTAVHEILGHDFLDRLIESNQEEDLKTIAEEYIKATKGKESVADVLKALKEFNVETNKTQKGTSIHEWFAKTAEGYFVGETQVKQGSKLAKLFDAFRAHLVELYNNMTNKSYLLPSNEMKKVFRKVFGENNFDMLNEIAQDEIIQTKKDIARAVPKAVTKELANKFEELRKQAKGLGQTEEVSFDELLAAAQWLSTQEGVNVLSVLPELKAMFPANEQMINENTRDFQQFFTPRGQKVSQTAQSAFDSPIVSEEGKQFVGDRLALYTPEKLKEVLSDVRKAFEDYSIENMMDAWLSGSLPYKELPVFLTELQFRVNRAIKATENGTKEEKEYRKRLISYEQKILDKIIEEGKSTAQRLNYFKIFKGMSTAGKIMHLKRNFNKANEKTKALLDIAVKSLREKLSKAYEDNDYFLGQISTAEEKIGSLTQEVSDLNKQIEARAKRKDRERIGSPKRPENFNNKISVSDALAKYKKAKGLGQDLSSLTEQQTLAYALMQEKSKTIEQFVKEWNKVTGEKRDINELEETYKAVRQFATEVDGFEKDWFDTDSMIDESIEDYTNFKNDVELKKAQRDLELEIAKAEVAAFKKQMSDKDKEVKAREALKKREKQIVNDFLNSLGQDGLWQKYVQSNAGKIVGNLASKIGGKPAEKALLDKFITLATNEINSAINELTPNQKAKKTTPNYAQQLGDLISNQDKVAEVFDKAVKEFAEQHANDVNAQALLSKLSGLKNPFSEGLLGKALEKEADNYAVKIKDLAFKYVGLKPILKQQIIDQIVAETELTGVEAQQLKDDLMAKFDAIISETETDVAGQLATALIADSKKTLGLMPKQSDYVKELLGYLKNKAKDFYKSETNKTLVDPIDQLKYAVEMLNDANGKKIWDDSKAEVIKKIDNDPTLSQTEKDNLKQHLDNYQNTVLDQLLSSNKLFNNIKQVIINETPFVKNGAVDWNKMITQAKGNVAVVKDIIRQSIEGKVQGYNQQQIDAVLDAIGREFEARINEKKATIIEKQLKDIQGGKIIRQKKIAKGKIQKLIEMENSGALDDVRFEQELGKYLGMKEMTPQKWARLRELIIDSEEAPEGNERDRAIEKMSAYIKLNSVGKTAEIYTALYYAGMLARPTTIIKNATGISEPIIRLMYKALTDIKYAKMMLQGLKRGDAKDIWGGGIVQGSKLDEETGIDGLPRVNMLSQMGAQTNNKFTKFVAGAGRILDLLTMADAISQAMVGSGAEYGNYVNYLLEENKEAIKLDPTVPVLTKGQAREQAFNELTNKLTFDGAMMEAKSEFAKRGIIPSEARLKRRAYELTREMILPIQVRELAQSTALEEAYKSKLPSIKSLSEEKETDRRLTENAGLFTYLGSGVNEIVQALSNLVGGGLGFVARQLPVSEARGKKLDENLRQVLAQRVLPFARGMSNVMEQSLEKTPYGIIKGGISLGLEYKNYRKTTSLQEAVEHKYMMDRAKDKIAKSAASMILGGIFYSTVMAISRAGDDDDEKENRKLEAQGKPTSYRLKTGFYSAGEIVKYGKNNIERYTFPTNCMVIGGRVIPLSLLGTQGIGATIVANMYDNFIKKAKKQENKTQDPENIENMKGYNAFMLSTGNTVLSMSAYSSLSDLSEAVSPTSNSKVSDYMSQIAVKSAVLPIPYVGTFGQVAQGARYLFGDKSAQTAIGLDERAWKEFGLQGIAYDRPVYNYRGKIVSAPQRNTEGVAGLVGIADKWKLDPIDNYLYKELNYNPTLNKRLSNKFQNKEKAGMTKEEYYDYGKEVGQEFNLALERNYERLKTYEYTPKQIEKIKKDESITQEKVLENLIEKKKDFVADLQNAIENKYTLIYQLKKGVITNEKYEKDKIKINERVETLEKYLGSIIKKPKKN